jgi:chromosome segregation protein
LGEPTTESIRQALLADEARIAYSPPTIPSQRILEFKVESSLTGNTFELVVNDGFTALIGGRGSGKSAVLEYLRFGLGRSSIDVRLTESETERERNLITETLKGGKVTVVLERDGVVESWVRLGDSRDCIEIQTTDGQTELITIPSAQQRFRARAFSQKQLSTLVITSKAVDQITGIAAAESIIKRQEIEDAIARIKREIQSNVQRLVEYWVAEAEHKNATAVVKDITRRIEATKKKLEQSGLSPESQAVLDEAPVYRAADSLLSEAEMTITSEIEFLKQRTDPFASLADSRWKKTEKFEEVHEFVEQVRKTQQLADSAFEQIRTALLSLKDSSEQARKSFTDRQNKFQVRHRIASAEQDALKSQIQELDKLVNEPQEAEARERQAEKREQQLIDATSKLAAVRMSLNSQLQINKELLESASTKVAAMSNKVLMAEVRREIVPKEFVEALLAICENQRVREASDRCEGRVVEIMQQGGNAWAQVADSFLELFKARVQAGSTSSEPSEEVRQLLHSVLFDLTEQQTVSIYNGLTADKIARVLMASPLDFIAFEYKDASSYIPFENASPGQQAAALLNLLLQQEAGTLIIDQPEDDLDNKVIMHIVKLLQTAKQKRQLIFGTHNANFVVNGDADKVVALAPGVSHDDVTETPRIAIELDGAIETPNVSTLIKDTVEGGQKAFELRRRKYGIATLGG